MTFMEALDAEHFILVELFPLDCYPAAGNGGFFIPP